MSLYEWVTLLLIILIYRSGREEGGKRKWKVYIKKDVTVGIKPRKRPKKGLIGLFSWLYSNMIK